EDMPVVATTANQWDDPGMEQAYERLRALVEAISGNHFVRKQPVRQGNNSEAPTLIAPARVRYLAEIADTVHSYRKETERLAERAADASGIARALADVGETASSEVKQT